MAAAPLAGCAWVTHGPDDQGRHPGQQAEALRLSVSWPRYSLIVQALRLGACLLVGDPIDGFAHVLESLRCDVCGVTSLRPECERGPLALAHVGLSPRSRRVCAWL